MSVEETIKSRIEQNLAPSSLEIINESHKHAGHAGDNGSGESHFKVVMTSPLFAGKTKIQRHQMVFKVLDDLIPAPVHALSLSLEELKES